MENLNGKTAVITGGASGIGLAMAHRFGAAGMNLHGAGTQDATIEYDTSEVPPEQTASPKHRPQAE